MVMSNEPLELSMYICVEMYHKHTYSLCMKHMLYVNSYKYDDYAELWDYIR